MITDGAKREALVAAALTYAGEPMTDQLAVTENPKTDVVKAEAPTSGP